MAAVAAGDVAAFERVHAAVRTPVLHAARRVLRDPAQAEDVAQEALFEMWRTAGRYDPQRGSPRAWIVTMARHRAIDRVRAGTRSAARDLQAARESLPTGCDDIADRVANDVDVARRGPVVQAALAALPERQRQALVTVYYQERTHTEAALALDVPLGTLKGRVRDGLRHLRDGLSAA